MANSNPSSEARSVSWNCSSLPPKGPSTTTSGSSAETAGLPFTPRNKPQHHHQRTASFVVQQSQFPWIDDMLETPPDNGSRKILHRRSSSDSAAFLDVGPSGTMGTLDDPRRDQQNEEEFVGYRSLAFTQLPGSGTNRSSSDLERLDDEQIMSMFTDAEQRCRSTSGASTAAALDSNAAAGAAATSSPSDSNSGNDMSIEDGKPGPLSCPKTEPEEVQSIASKQLMSNGIKQPTASTHIDPNMDPKRAKRILANRQSAQRSRVRKLQYIAELERSVSALQTEVSALTPQVAFLDHQRLLLNVDNNTIKQRIASLMQDKRFKDAHNDALSREVHRLRQVLQQQQDELRSQQERQQQEEYNGILKAETSSPLSNGFEMDTKPATCLLDEGPRHQHHLIDHTEFPE